MTASVATVKDVVKIMVEEIGQEKTISMLERMVRETTGNESYLKTISALYLYANGTLKL
jgi:hypothetical protein